MTTLANDRRSPLAAGLSGAILGAPDPGVLERNLAALSRWSPGVAERVRHCAPRSDLRFLRTDDGVPSVEVVDVLGPCRALASRRRPLREAEQLADTVDIASNAAVGVMGFGAGHHVAELARRMRRTGVIAVFEPDVALLRAVLERIDHSRWLAESNTAFFTDPDDAATISARLAGAEGVVMAGLTLLEHPPSQERLGEARTRFYKNLQDVVAAIRTMVATTMVMGRTTFSNITRNLGWYVSSPGIADLAGVWGGRPAIVVSAGPSLARNIEQLARPGVRDRFVIIATQTVLKPLLARGVKPHFVVALDHSDISARFYEGLTAEDVRGVTLVVEPKVSPAVPCAFPGAIRIAREPLLDALLGAELSRDMGVLPAGATVAHLAYYLARHLGADPVVLVGQDLGFTDGQYYAAGAAIHNVWASELNQFNTLERMEWERIKRMGSHLRRATDQQARPIYTDEQMATYLVQFERDFLADTHRGLQVIDATEGGVAKRHTRAEALREVVDRVLTAESPGAHAGSVLGAPLPNPVGRRRVEERVREVLRDVHHVGERSREAAGVLREMLAHHADQRRVSRLIDRVNALRDDVERATPAIELVHARNQAGAFARLRADRSIHLDAALSPLERQRREIERDIANVELIARTADDLRSMLSYAADVLARWRPGEPAPLRPSESRSREGHAVEALGPVPAFVTVDASSLALAGDWPLRLTLRRLARCRRVNEIVLLAEQPEVVADVLARERPEIPWRVEQLEPLEPAARRRLRAARAPALECWRAGLGGATVYDEALRPRDMHRLMEERGLAAALVVRHDWCFLDPDLCDAVIERAQRSRSTHVLAISQAPPGAGGVVVGRRVAHELAKLQAAGSALGTLGALISYMPAAPCPDAIGRETCVPVDPALRDCGERLVPDSPRRAAQMRRVVDELGPEASVAFTPLEIARRLQQSPPPSPAYLTVEIDAASTLPTLEGLADVELCTIRATDGCVDRLRESLLAARAAMPGAVLHARLPVLQDTDTTALHGLGADIVSLDCSDARHAPRDLSAINGSGPAWIVPRLAKRDGTYEAIEGFYDHWLTSAGAASIDAAEAPDASERIQPLPLPPAAVARFQRTAMYVRADATVMPHEFFARTQESGPSIDAAGRPLAEVWNDVCRARRLAGRCSP